MLEKKVRIQNRLGLHARPAALIAKTAVKYKSKIIIRKNSMEVNAKSIMGVMTLAAGPGTEILIRTEGVDEKEALHSLIALVENKFEED